MERTSFIVPHGHAHARAYICIPVEESIASRSSVLASLMDCDGVVELPSGVDVSDLLTWAECQPDRAAKLSTEELSHALKIGDQLGDKHSSLFARAMADKLMETRWAEHPERISFLMSIISLNSNLKGLIFQSLAAAPFAMQRVASRWPVSMQLAFFDALVETGSITIPYLNPAGTVEDVLAVLSHTSTPSRGLTQLHIHSTVEPCTAAILSQALLHHSSSINSLNLPDVEQGALVNVLPAISQLSHLTRLQVTIPHHREQDAPTIRDTVDGLASTISNLPCLADVDLETERFASVESSSPPPRKLPKLCSADSTPPVLSLDPIIQALASAPSLTSLAIRFQSGIRNSTPFPCSGIKGPFLSLQQLSLSVGVGERSTHASHLVPTLSPLPALTKLKVSCQPFALTDRPLIESILRQAALQSAVVNLESVLHEAVTLLQEGMHVLTRLSHLAMAFNGMTALRPATVHAIYQGIAQLTALTSLDITAPNIPIDNRSAWSVSDINDRLMSPLAQCTGLRDLRYFCRALNNAAEEAASAESLVSHVLPGLQRLTHLELIAEEWHEGKRKINIAGALLQGMPALPELRHLSLAALIFDSDNQARLWFEALDLRHMTQLELLFSPLTEGSLQCLAQRLQGAQEMQVVKVTGHGHTVAEGWTRGIPAMPRRGQYEFRCTYSHIEGHDEAAQALQERGFVVEESSKDAIRFNFPHGGDVPVGAAVSSAPQL